MLVKATGRLPLLAAFSASVWAKLARTDIGWAVKIGVEDLALEACGGKEGTRKSTRQEFVVFDHKES